MIIEKNTLQLEQITNNLMLDYNLEDIILFDIETTGLSHSKHMIYLIGYMFLENNSWHVVNLLATCLEDEELIIKTFFEQLNNKKFLIHFNGSNFDIPFINSKAKRHHITSPLEHNSNIHSIDLYKLCKKHSSLLNLENYKLKTIEQALGILRKDLYTGKELIEKYYEFIKLYSLDTLKKDFSNSDPLKSMLLLHNYEDIINMLPLLNIFKYDLLKEKHFTIAKYEIIDSTLIIECELKYHENNYSLPINISHTLFNEYAPLTISSSNNILTIKVPIIDNELKYFYSDYKNYYYLPAEDTAIHKSVGTYVNKDYRQPAKSYNCYLKKESSYIPINNTNILPIFKADFSSKELFTEINDSFLNNYLLEYIYNLF